LISPREIARFGDSGFRHRGEIIALAFGASGKTLASACDSPVITVWELPSRKKLWEATKLTAAQRCLAYTRDYKNLVSGGTDGNVLWWESSTGRAVSQIRIGDGAISAIAFSSDGQLFATASESGWVDVWKVSNLTKPFRFAARSGLNCVAFAADSKLLAAAGQNDTLTLWDLASGRILKELPGIKTRTSEWPNLGDLFGSSGMPGGVCYVGFLPGSTKLCAAVRGDPPLRCGELKVWDFDKDKQLAGPLPPGGWDIYSVSISPDGKSIALGMAGGYVKLVRPETNDRFDIGGGSHEIGSNVAFSPDGQMLATGGRDHMIHLWDTSTRTRLDSSRGHQGPLSAVTFLSNSILVTAGEDNKARVWDLGSKQEMREIANEHAARQAFAVSSESKLLALGAGQPVNIWELGTGRLVRTLPYYDLAFVRSILFSPDGKFLAVGNDRKACVYVWNVATGTIVRRFGSDEQRPGGVECLALSPDGELLCSPTGENGEIDVWVMARGERKFQLGNENIDLSFLAFAPNGRILAGGGWRGCIYLWDTAAGREIGRLIAHQRRVTGVAFSPTGRIMASASDDGTVLVWDLSTSDVKGRITGRFGNVSPIAFSPNAKMLATANMDGTATVWDVSAYLHCATNQGKNLDTKQLATLWNDLGSMDGRVADSAIWKLVARPSEAIALLGADLARDGKVDRSQEKTSISSSRLRTSREIEILELIGTERAVELLDEISKRKTDFAAEAKAELNRVKKWQSPNGAP
jgi:WD40 repeat protein